MLGGGTSYQPSRAIGWCRGKRGSAVPRKPVACKHGLFNQPWATLRYGCRLSRILPLAFGIGSATKALSKPLHPFSCDQLATRTSKLYNHPAHLNNQRSKSLGVFHVLSYHTCKSLGCLWQRRPPGLMVSMASIIEPNTTPSHAPVNPKFGCGGTWLGVVSGYVSEGLSCPKACKQCDHIGLRPVLVMVGPFYGWIIERNAILYWDCTSVVACHGRRSALGQAYLGAWVPFEEQVEAG